MLIALSLFLVAVIVAVIYIFLIMPRATFRADTDVVCNDFAHRGLHGGSIPENSLAAFEKAASAGYGIELDVMLSSDGVVMVHHDDTLKRMCGVNKKLSLLTLKEIKSYSLAATSEKIPTLSEVLELIDGRVPLLIEIKGTKKDPALCEAIALILDSYDGPFCIESFNPLILAYFKEHRPRYARGQLVTHIKKQKGETDSVGALQRFLLSHMLTNFISRPDFLAMDGRYMRSFGFIICTRLFFARSLIWTVRTERELEMVRKNRSYSIFENIRP